MVDIKAIRVISFSGKEEDWNRWSKTFIATMTAKGRREVIKPTDITKKADVDANVQVYNDLVLSCQEDVTFGIIDEAISTDFPDGDARLAWKNLTEKYEPTTGASKVQLKQEFHQCKLASVDDDPEVWITQLELKRRRLKVLGATIDDDDLILHILNHLPKEYETVVELCEEELSNGTLTLTRTKERIRARFARIKRSQEDSDEGIALMMKNKFKGACNVCGKIGHKGSDCWTLDKNKSKKKEFFAKMKEKKFKKKNKNKSNEKSNEKAASKDDTEIVLMANEIKKFGKHTWIADSGASTHMCNDLSAMINLKETNQSISIGDGTKITATKIGTVRGEFTKANGDKTLILLTNVSYVPDLLVNLFSLTSAMEKDFTIIGSKQGIEIKKGKSSMLFHEKFGTAKGHIFGTTISPVSALALVSNTKIQKTFEEAHQVLGHPEKKLIQGTSNRLGWKLMGEDMTACEECLIAKARRTNLPKTAKNPSKTPGERIMIDISSVRNKENIKSGRFWLLVVDEATNMKWSFFLHTKKQQTPVLLGFIKTLKELGRPVKFIRCDNAGENETLKKQLDLQGSSIRFEYTARQTPQQNGKVERAFASLYGRMRAMMLGAGLDESSKMKLWMEAAATATKLDNILSVAGESSPYKNFYGEDPKYQDHLRIFGEIGIVTKNPGSSIKAKLDDRGEKCLFLGYAANHAPNVYRMWNLKTEKVMITRDVKWSGKFLESTTMTTSIETPEDDDEDEEEIENTQIPQPPTDDPPLQMAPVVAPVRISRELRALQPFNLPGRLELEGQDNHFCFFVPDSIDNPAKDPTTFDEAWNHPDSKEKHFWREAIRLEFRQMIKNKVWRKEGVENLPPNRKGIGTKWVFKKKKNGVYRARLVVKGYDQVAGIDFQYNFAPVTSEVTLRILLILWIVENYFGEVADVQTAFLHGDLEEEIFIRIPSGYQEFLAEQGESIQEKFLQLTKSTYGLVQAARSWWQKFTSVLKKELNFEQHASDSCLLKRVNEHGKVFLIIYVDDCFVVGDKKAVKQALDDVQTVFNITRSENIEDFIGCHIQRVGDKVMLSQPDLIKKMLEKFEEKIENLKKYDTPATASSHVKRCLEEENGLNDEDQQEFRSGVGSLLYLLKHSRPDLSNSVRELSKVMDRANKAHEKMLHRVIRFVEQTKNRCLVLAPMKKNLTWDLKGYCDSDFAGDSDTRKSVSGFVIYLCGAAIAWRSKGQKSVTLSSTEAEYVAISEVATEILYIAGILKFLNIPLEYPITVNVDNIGAIYLTKNATTGSRTKHVDTRYHFVRDYVEDGIIKVQFVRSEENHADIFTKNLNSALFEKHSDSVGMEDMDTESTTPKMRNRKGVENMGVSHLSKYMIGD